MKATIFAVIVLAFSTSHAFAVSLTVKLACKDDYFAHCSQHAVGTPGVRKCMRDVGPRLSTRCIGALADAGMIRSKAVTKTYQTKTKVAQKQPSKKKYAAKTYSKKHYAKAQYSKKKYAKKAESRKKVASKSDRKKRYASKPAKKRYSKQDNVRKDYGKKRLALAAD